VNMLLVLAWLAAVDGGVKVAPTPPVPPSSSARLSDEDAEVLKNLELLEHLEEAKDLEMLQELTVEH
jgi:hypothetical protein